MGLKGPPLPSQLWLPAPWGSSIWGSPHFNLGYAERRVTPSHVQGRPPGAETINAESPDLEIAPWRGALVLGTADSLSQVSSIRPWLELQTRQKAPAHGLRAPLCCVTTEGSQKGHWLFLKDA